MFGDYVLSFLNVCELKRESINFDFVLNFEELNLFFWFNFEHLNFVGL